MYGDFYLKRWQMYIDALRQAWDHDEDLDQAVFLKALKEFEFKCIHDVDTMYTSCKEVLVTTLT